jgi:hypothetical protein
MVTYLGASQRVQQIPSRCWGQYALSLQSDASATERSCQEHTAMAPWALLSES